MCVNHTFLSVIICHPLLEMEGKSSMTAVGPVKVTSVVGFLLFVVLLSVSGKHQQCVCAYVCAHICMCTCIDVHGCAYIHVHVSVCMCMRSRKGERERERFNGKPEDC